MKIENFCMGAKGKLAKAVADFDVYIDYWAKAKNGAKPQCLTVSRDVYEEIAKKATAYCKDNNVKRDGKLTYQDILITGA